MLLFSLIGSSGVRMTYWNLGDKGKVLWCYIPHISGLEVSLLYSNVDSFLLDSKRLVYIASLTGWRNFTFHPSEGEKLGRIKRATNLC